MDKKTTVSRQEAEILKDVIRHPKSTVGQIKERTGLGLSTVCRITKRLDEKGLVKRSIYDDGKKIDARSLMIEVKKNV